MHGRAGGAQRGERRADTDSSGAEPASGPIIANTYVCVRRRTALSGVGLCTVGSREATSA